MKNYPKKILLIGPRINKKKPELTGGPIVFFEGFIEELNKNNISYIVIDTNKRNYSNIFIAYIFITFLILFKQRNCDHIMLNSSRDYLFFGTIIIFIGKIFKKKTSMRKFGAEALDVYEESNGIQKYLLHFVYSRIDTLFFQAKYLVDFFSKINKNTFWFPNVRKRNFQAIIPRSFKKRFVFVSHVRPDKGIDTIIDTIKLLDNTYTIDIYGPILDEKYSKEYFKKHNISYKGALKSDSVIQKLNEYDVLMLPSYYKGEGYPGTILEAYSLGMPVISTTLRPIMEIVDPYETGILIEPKNIQELSNAIHFFNENNYLSMSKNAYEKFNDFEFEQQIKNYLERI